MDLYKTARQAFEAILATPPGCLATVRADHLGTTRLGLPLYGYRIPAADAPQADEPLQVSLIAGCHADEPVGPRLLEYLVAWLGRCDPRHPLRQAVDWWIVPHANPDGAVANAPWQTPHAKVYEWLAYQRHRRRDAPGEDLEFGFPTVSSPPGPGLRPEGGALARWWQGAERGFHLHASLHGLSQAPGPWYLLDAAWIHRAAPLIARCRAATLDAGYVLNPVNRGGEKGFQYVAEGFSTCPNAAAMAAHFLALNDSATAARFRPSSMDHHRALAATRGGDPLTLVTEMPLFIGEPSDANAPPMPVRDQMWLQWQFLAAGLDLVATVRSTEKSG